MKRHFEFTPERVCAQLISFDIEDGKLYGIHFSGGCPGNTAAIAKLLEGADAKKTAEILKGNLCGTRQTSCADQLAISIEQALAS